MSRGRYALVSRGRGRNPLDSKNCFVQLRFEVIQAIIIIMTNTHTHELDITYTTAHTHHTICAFSDSIRTHFLTRYFLNQISHSPRHTHTPAPHHPNFPFSHPQFHFPFSLSFPGLCSKVSGFSGLRSTPTSHSHLPIHYSSPFRD